MVRGRPTASVGALTAGLITKPCKEGSMTESPSTLTVLIIPPLMVEAVAVRLLLEALGGDPWSAE